MRHRNGKGLTFAIDAKIKIFVDEWRREKGYYPSLREISENFDPPRSVGLVFYHLRRLSAAGNLTPEAELIYGKKKKCGGPVLVFDEFVERTLEAMKAELGHYPPLKKIGERCTPPQPVACVDRSLRRLAAAGRLSKEAMQVYNAKNNIKYITGETAHEKTSKSRKAENRKGRE